MSTFELTYNDWTEMDQSDRRVLEALPKYKAIVLEFKQADEAKAKAEAVENAEFSKQAYFELPDGSQVSLEVLEMLMYSKLGGQSEDTTQYGIIKTASYGLKNRIKSGFQARGILYHFGIKELNAKNSATAK